MSVFFVQQLLVDAKIATLPEQHVLNVLLQALTSEVWLTEDVNA